MIFKRILMRKEFIVHLPKLLLFTGGVSRDCSPQGVGMCSHVREVTKNKSQVVTQQFARLLYDRKQLSAVNAFKVSVFEKGDRCRRWSEQMVPLVYGVLEFDFLRTHLNPSSLNA
jgi:hypothetical protein